MSKLTDLLNRASSKDEVVLAELMNLVYEELHRLAEQQMARESPDNTLQPTALIHEAYMRIFGSEQAQRWDSRRHFYAAAAEAMRRILIDHARRRQSIKRGGNYTRIRLEESMAACPAPDGQLLLLNASLERLAEEDPRKAELVKLRYFGGLSVQDCATALGISRSTAHRYWLYSKAWLYADMCDDDTEPME